MTNPRLFHPKQEDTLLEDICEIVSNLSNLYNPSNKAKETKKDTGFRSKVFDPETRNVTVELDATQTDIADVLLKNGASGKDFPSAESGWSRFSKEDKLAIRREYQFHSSQFESIKNALQARTEFMAWMLKQQDQDTVPDHYPEGFQQQMENADFDASSPTLHPASQ